MTDRERHDIKRQISKNTEGAIERLIDLCAKSSNNKQLNELILLQSRWNDNSHLEKMDLTDLEKIARERNKIRKSLLDICDTHKVLSSVVDEDSGESFDKGNAKSELITKFDEILDIRHIKIDAYNKNILFSRISRLKINLTDYNLLWIDDRSERSKNDSGFLGKLGFNVIIANSSEEAFRYIEEKRIDIIISDIKRNGKKEGLEFLKNLRDRRITIPLIFYIEFLKEERGTPPYAFGITNDPKELVHLLLDIIERTY